jgi:hypothetical protein
MGLGLTKTGKCYQIWKVCRVLDVFVLLDHFILVLLDARVRLVERLAQLLLQKHLRWGGWDVCDADDEHEEWALAMYTST